MEDEEERGQKRINITENTGVKGKMFLHEQLLSTGKDFRQRWVRGSLN